MMDLIAYFKRKLDLPFDEWLKDNADRFQPVKDVIGPQMREKYKIKDHMFALCIDANSPELQTILESH